AFSPTCWRNTNKSGGNILPVRPEATCGSTLATCPLRPETPCGKGAGESWPFRLLEAVPKAFLSGCHHSRRPAGTRWKNRRIAFHTSAQIALLLKLRIDKPRLPNR